jgi:hypothetical protein
MRVLAIPVRKSWTHEARLHEMDPLLAHTSIHVARDCFPEKPVVRPSPKRPVHVGSMGSRVYRWISSRRISGGPRSRLIVVIQEQSSPNVIENAFAGSGSQLNRHATMVARPPLSGIGIEGMHS